MRNYAPVGAKPSIHGRRLFLTEHGRLSQAEAVGSSDMGGVWPLQVIAATSAASVTSTNTETTFPNATLTIPANYLRAGSILEFEWAGSATSATGADTLQIKAYIGSTAVATGAVTSVTAGNVFAGRCVVDFRSVGAAGQFVANANHVKTPGASLTASRVDEITAATAIDTTAAVSCTVKATWGATSSTDIAKMDLFRAKIT